jgi:hypothetical protein
MLTKFFGKNTHGGDPSEGTFGDLKNARFEHAHKTTDPYPLFLGLFRKTPFLGIDPWGVPWGLLKKRKFGKKKDRFGKKNRPRVGKRNGGDPMAFYSAI